MRWIYINLDIASNPPWRSTILGARENGSTKLSNSRRLPNDDFVDGVSYKQPSPKQVSDKFKSVLTYTIVRASFNFCTDFERLKCFPWSMYRPHSAHTHTHARHSSHFAICIFRCHFPFSTSVLRTCYTYV